ncbi:hypothetical protein HDU85_004017 [Gaertneriomyces sp. JEL0708]|nr:hypothetical protein HDU85_004017 [Gaertneriomyces sp. JEL0708]
MAQSNIYTPPPPPSSSPSPPVPLHKIPVGSLKHTQTVEALLQRRISTRQSLSSPVATRRATTTSISSKNPTTVNGFLVPTVAVRTTSLSFPVSYVIDGHHHHTTNTNTTLARSSTRSSYHPLGRMCKPKTLSVDPTTARPCTSSPSHHTGSSSKGIIHEPRRLRRSQSLTRHTARSTTPASGQPNQQQQQQGHPKRQRCQSVTLGFLKEARRRSRVYASASDLVTSLAQSQPVEQWAAVTRQEVLEGEKEGGSCDVASLAVAAEPGSVDEPLYRSHITSSSPTPVSVDEQLYTSHSTSWSPAPVPVYTPHITSSSPDAFPLSQPRQEEEHQPVAVGAYDSLPTSHPQVDPYVEPLVHPLLPLTTCKLVRSSLPLRHRLHCYHLLLDLQPLFPCSGEMSGYDRLTVPTRKRKRDRARLVSIAEGKRTTPSPLRYELDEHAINTPTTTCDSDGSRSSEEMVDLNKLLFKGGSGHGFKPADNDTNKCMTMSPKPTTTPRTSTASANLRHDDIEPYEGHNHPRKHVRNSSKSKRQSIISVRPKRSFSQELRYKICMTLKLDRFTPFSNNNNNNNDSTCLRSSFSTTTSSVRVSYDVKRAGSVDTGAGVPRSEKKKRGLRKKVSMMFMGERVRRREAEFYVAVEA